MCTYITHRYIQTRHFPSIALPYPTRGSDSSSEDKDTLGDLDLPDDQEEADNSIQDEANR